MFISFFFVYLTGYCVFYYTITVGAKAMIRKQQTKEFPGVSRVCKRGFISFLSSLQYRLKAVDHEFIVPPRNKIAKCLCSNLLRCLDVILFVYIIGIVKHVIKEYSSGESEEQDFLEFSTILSFVNLFLHEILQLKNF